MTFHEIAETLTKKVGQYRSTFSGLTDMEALAGSQMIATTIDRIIVALEKNDKQQAVTETLVFSRQLSDVYFTHPPVVCDLANIIQRLRKELKNQ